MSARRTRLALGFGLDDFLQRIARETFVGFQPSQKRRRKAKVFVGRLRRARLACTPAVETVRADVAKALPTAFLAEPGDAVVRDGDVFL